MFLVRIVLTYKKQNNPLLKVKVVHWGFENLQLNQQAIISAACGSTTIVIVFNCNRPYIIVRDKFIDCNDQIDSISEYRNQKQVFTACFPRRLHKAQDLVENNPFSAIAFETIDSKPFQKCSSYSTYLLLHRNAKSVHIANLIARKV